MLSEPEVAVTLAESVTRAVNVHVVALDGVPVIAPALEMLREHDVSEPEAIAQVYGGVPPAALSDCE